MYREGRVPVNTTASRVTICMRQEGNLVQHKVISWRCFKLLKSDPELFTISIFVDRAILEAGFLVTIISMKLKV